MLLTEFIKRRIEICVICKKEFYAYENSSVCSLKCNSKKNYMRNRAIGKEYKKSLNLIKENKKLLSAATKFLEIKNKNFKEKDIYDLVDLYKIALKEKELNNKINKDE